MNFIECHVGFYYRAHRFKLMLHAFQSFTQVIDAIRFTASTNTVLAQANGDGLDMVDRFFGSDEWFLHFPAVREN